jgi:hypothetical protein
VGSTADLNITKIVNQTLDIEPVASRFLTVAEVAENGSLGTEISKGPIVTFLDDV